MIKRMCSLVLVAAMLTGCAGFDAAVSGANTYVAGELRAQQKGIESANDNVAATWAMSGCAIPYGEIVRNGSGNPNLAAAVITLCGSPSGTTIIRTIATPTAITTIPSTTVAAPAAVN